MVTHEFLVAHPPDFYRSRLLEPVRKLQSGRGNLSIAKLKQHYEEAFINLFGAYPPPGWMAGRAPVKTRVTYNLLAAVIADVMKARCRKLVYMILKLYLNRHATALRCGKRVHVPTSYAFVTDAQLAPVQALLWAQEVLFCRQGFKCT